MKINLHSYLTTRSFYSNEYKKAADAGLNTTQVVKINSTFFRPYLTDTKRPPVNVIINLFINDQVSSHLINKSIKNELLFMSLLKGHKSYFMLDPHSGFFIISDLKIERMTTVLLEYIFRGLYNAGLMNQYPEKAIGGVMIFNKYNISHITAAIYNKACSGDSFEVCKYLLERDEVIKYMEDFLMGLEALNCRPNTLIGPHAQWNLIRSFRENNESYIKMKEFYSRL